MAKGEIVVVIVYYLRRLQVSVAKVVEQELSGLRKGRVARVNVVVAVGVGRGVFLGVVTGMLVALEDGARADVFVGQWIAGIPQVDSALTAATATAGISSLIRLDQHQTPEGDSLLLRA